MFRCLFLIARAGAINEQERRRKRNSIEPIDWYFDCWVCLAERHELMPHVRCPWYLPKCKLLVQTARGFCVRQQPQKKSDSTRICQAFDALIVFIVNCVSAAEVTKYSQLVGTRNFHLFSEYWCLECLHENDISWKFCGWTARLRNEILFLISCLLDDSIQCLPLIVQSSMANRNKIASPESQWTAYTLFLGRCK